MTSPSSNTQQSTRKGVVGPGGNFSQNNQNQARKTQEIIAEKIKTQRQALVDKQRYQFSPNIQQPDIKKPAWERLIERSFDPKTAQFMKNYKETQKQLDKQHTRNMQKMYGTTGNNFNGAGESTIHETQAQTQTIKQIARTAAQSPAKGAANLMSPKRSIDNYQNMTMNQTQKMFNGRPPRSDKKSKTSSNQNLKPNLSTAVQSLNTTQNEAKFSKLMEYQLKNGLGFSKEKDHCCMTQQNSNQNSFMMSSPIRHVDSTMIAEQRVFSQPRKQTHAWKDLMDKTSDCKVQKSDANYSERRTVEQFLSGRTLNPMKYSQHANLLLIAEHKKQDKKMNQLSSQKTSNKTQDVDGITGCRRKSNERVHKHQFKMGYTYEELNKMSQGQSQTGNLTNQSHFNDGLKLNDSQPIILGCGTQQILLQDKTNISSQPNPGRQTKNQLDFCSSIECLKPQQTLKDAIYETVKQTGKARPTTCKSSNQSSFFNSNMENNGGMHSQNQEYVSSQRKRPTDQIVKQQFNERIEREKVYSSHQTPMSVTNKSAQKFDMFTRGARNDDKPLSMTGRSTPTSGMKNAFKSQIDRLG
eukprot:403366222